MEPITEEQIIRAAKQANQDQRDLVERVKKSKELETPIEGKDENPSEDENYDPAGPTAGVSQCEY